MLSASWSSSTRFDASAEPEEVVVLPDTGVAVDAYVAALVADLGSLVAHAFGAWLAFRIVRVALREYRDYLVGRRLDAMLDDSEVAEGWGDSGGGGGEGGASVGFGGASAEGSEVEEEKEWDGGFRVGGVDMWGSRFFSEGEVVGGEIGPRLMRSEGLVPAESFLGRHGVYWEGRGFLPFSADFVGVQKFDLGKGEQVWLERECVGGKVYLQRRAMPELDLWSTSGRSESKEIDDEVPW